MNLLKRRLGKRGAVSEQTFKWILYLIILIAAGVVVRNIIGKFGG